MKKRSLLFLIALLTVCSGVFAQVNVMIEETKRGPYVTNGFWDNIFISAGAGGLVYWGDHDGYATFGGRIAPSLDVSLGKWITPSVGMRLQYSGLKAKGWTANHDSNWWFGDTDVNGYTREKFNLNYLHFDVMWNLSNAIGGYRSDRFYDFVPYAGFGWVNGNHDDRPNKNDFGFNAGLYNKMRLSNAVDLFIDLRWVMLRDDFNGAASPGGKKIDYTTSATIGFTYNFNRNTFRRVSDVIAVDFSAYEARVNALENDLAAARARADQLARDLAAANARQPETIYQTNNLTPDMAIFFVINRAEISEKEMINLEFMANIIKQTPNKTFTLIGSADKETGTPPYNMRLSERRAEAVRDALVKFGVNPNQLVLKPEGDTNNRFPKPALNRVVIVENN